MKTRPVWEQVCKPSVGNHLLYLHMSSHYRRIYATKCVVDTSPPRGASNRWQPHIRTCSPKKYGLGFADITSDTKQSPHAYTKHAWTELSHTRTMTPHKQQYQCLEGEGGHCRGRTSANKESWQSCRRVQDMVDQHASSFKLPDQAFKPRILKTEAQSRLRNLRVYHPPRRKSRSHDSGDLHEQEKQQHQPSEEEVMSGGTSARCSDVCDAQKHVSSKESSRDSAYDGGASSGTGSREPTPVAVCPVVLSRRLTAQKVKKKENAAYTKFVHDITEDVLAQGIYSDQGLWRLFQRHVTANKGQLNMDRIQDEVARLCDQLGIARTTWSNGGSQLLHVTEGKKTSCDNFLSEAKEVAQGRVQATLCMKKVMKIPCQTVCVSMSDETVGSGSAGVLHESEKPKLIGSTGTISCQISEISLTNQSVSPNKSLVTQI